MSRVLAIDAVGAKHGGAAQITLAIVEAALRSPHIGETIIFLSPQSKRDFSLPASDKLTQVPVPWAESQVGRVAWFTRGLPRAALKHRATNLLTLSGGGLAPASFSTSMFIQQSLPFSREAIATLPWPVRTRIAAIRHMMAMAAARAANLVVQTETMADLVADEFRFDPARIHIVPPGVPTDVLASRTCERRDAETQEGLRLLYVGNSSPYKNLVILERTLDELHRAGRPAVLAATIESTHRLGMRPDVEPLGMLSRQRLLAEYCRASCLVMPSLTETVGLPLLEAMALGVPIVAADRPYAREICGSAALYFNPLEPASLFEAIGSLKNDESLRRQLAASGRRRAAVFSAADAYERVLDVVLH